MSKKETNKRIAFFMTAFAGGGAERIAITLAKGFVEKGYNVDLVVTSSRGPLKSEVPSNVRLVDLKAPRIARSFFSLLKYIKKVRPSVMYSHMKSTNCLAIWARQLSGVNMGLVVVEHNTLSQSITADNSFKTKLLPSLMKYSYPYADEIVAVSKGVANDLSDVIDIPRKNIEVIYNPVFTQDMIEKSREEVGHSWFKPDAPPVILGVGSLTKQKNFSLLIDAFERVRRKVPSRLLILGEGKLRAEIKAKVQKLGLENEVWMPGFVDNPYKYMANGDCFVLSSNWEGLPTVLIEAIACGTPVVSTDCPSGPSEILERGKWGKLVSIENVKEMSNAIVEFLKRDDKPNIAQRAEDFSVEEAVIKYLELFRN